MTKNVKWTSDFRYFWFIVGAAKSGLNVHNVAHYVHNVRWWGPLWGYSCFSFEDMNGDCVDAVHGTGNVARQVCLKKIYFCFYYR